MKTLKIIFVLALLVGFTSCSKDDPSDSNTDTPTGSNDDGGVVTGVETLILSGDITNEEATAEIAEKVGPETTAIVIQNTTQLTAVTISDVTKLLSLEIKLNNALTQVNFPNLREVVTFMSLSDNSQAETMSFPALRIVGNLVFNNNDKMRTLNYGIENLTSGSMSVTENAILETVNFQNLTFNNANDTSQILIWENTLLNSVEIPSLENIEQLYITLNPALVTLNFDGLVGVGELLNLIDNDSLGVIDFPSLKTLGGRIYFFNDDAVTSLNFPKLTRADGGLSIDNCNNLTLANFPLLSTIGEFMSVSDNNRLDTMDFSNLSSINGGLTVEDNTTLIGANFPNLTTINSTYSLSISRNAGLTTIQFDSLVTYADEIEIKSNPSLTMVAFPLLNDSSGLSLSYNEAIGTFSFPSLTSIAGDLEVLENVSLTDLVMPVLNTTGKLDVSDNILLNNLSLSNLATVTIDNFRIRNNNVLQSIQMEALETVESNFEVSRHNALINIGFTNLTTVKGSFSVELNLVIPEVFFPKLERFGTDTSFSVVRDNPQLLNVSFPLLTNAGKSLNIEGSPNLTQVGFPSLATVEFIQINESNALNGVDLSSVSDFETIFINSVLTTTDIDTLLAHLVALTPAIFDKRIDLEGSPSAQGILDAQTLRDQGNTVYY